MAPSWRTATAGCLASLCATSAAASPSHGTIRGISYGPVPLKSTQGGSELAMDDWMADAAKPMWGERGRGDLRVMKAMGANLVRLYGNNPENDHTAFLDEAQAQGLHVAPGMSDYPFYQMTAPALSCRQTDFNCYSQVKPMYLRNLEGGFMTSARTYHPALAYMIIINEPDLKMPPTTTVGGPEGPRKMCKAIISAFDAMLDAEKEAGLQGGGINFTATFSYAVCTACERFKTRPALGQMAQLDDAMRHPDKYGYSPKNNITEAYLTRWTHSFNTQNPASDLRPQFFNDYEVTFNSTPVFIAEYHKPDANQESDLAKVFEIINASKLFYGISYFEFQVAYWKGGTEEDFGVFGLGDYVIAEMPYFGKVYQVYCLVPVKNPSSGLTKPEVLTKAYGGQGLDADTLCIPSPQAVPVSDVGYQTIASQKSTSRMAIFLIRVVHHLGGVVTDTEGLLSFAERCVGLPGLTFQAAVVAISQKPPWTGFDPSSVCIADRDATATSVAEAIDWTCSKAEKFSCDDLPASCKLDPFTSADWVFSNYYKELPSADPLRNCYFDGAAMFASPSLFGSEEVGCALGKPPVHVTRRTTTTLPDSGADSTTRLATTAAPVGTTAAPLQVEAFVRLEVLNVNLAAVSATERSMLSSRYAAVLANFLGVPLADVRDAQGEGGKVDLLSGSIVIEGYLRGPVGVDIDGVIQKLNTPSMRNIIVDTTTTVLVGNQAAVQGAISTKGFAVSKAALPTPRPTERPPTVTIPEEASSQRTLPVWALWVMLAIIIALCGCLVYAWLAQPRKGRKRHSRDAERGSTRDLETTELLAPTTERPPPEYVTRTVVVPSPTAVVSPVQRQASWVLPAAAQRQASAVLPNPVVAVSSAADLGSFTGAPRRLVQQSMVGGSPSASPPQRYVQLPTGWR